VSIFSKFKRVMGIFKIPCLKREDQPNVQGGPSPSHSICRSIGGDPFAAYGDSFYNDKRSNIVPVAIPILATKPVAEDAEVEAYHPPAAFIFPPVKPLNIVKKQSVFPAQPNASTPSSYMGEYLTPRKPIASSGLDIVQVRKEITGLPPNYCVAGARYHTIPHTCDARKAIPAMASSEAGQLTQNYDDVEAEYISELPPASSDAVLRPHTRQSMFSKMKQSIRKSARSVLKPATSSKNRVHAAPIHGQSPIRPSGESFPFPLIFGF
jgi:hypothetical protein